MVPRVQTPRVTDGLVVVDIQNDFMPGGALGVRDGDAVIPLLNAWIDVFAAAKRPVFLTRDWHPADHCSFHDRGGPWPSHCIADTPGAEFAPSLHLPTERIIISKATTRDREAYSALAGTELARHLRAARIERIFLGGLATEYCVLNTVLDARAAGYRVVVLDDAIRAVNVRPGDGEAALRQIIHAGASLASAGIDA